MLTPIAASAAYRYQVALACANGSAMPKAAFLAFGSGSRPYDPATDQGLEAEFIRVSTSNSVAGPRLTVKGVLTGAQAGSNVVREVAVLTDTGTLMGRRVVAPKELEPETEIEFEIVFEY